MHKLPIFSLAMVLMVAAACGGGGPKKKESQLLPQDMTLKKGSGRQCPVVSGDYFCTGDKSDQDDGNESYFMRVRQTLDAANHTHFKISSALFTGDLLADGEIHRLDPSDRGVEYSVDCQTRSVSWHIVAERRFNTIATIQWLNPKAASFDVITFENGETIRIHRDCKLDPVPHSFD